MDRGRAAGRARPWSSSTSAGVRRTPRRRPRSRRPARRRGRAAAGPAASRRRSASPRRGRRGPSGSRRRCRAPSVVGAEPTRARPTRPTSPSLNRRCTPCGGLAEPAREVAGVEQRDPDPGLRGRRDQRVRHRVRVGVRRPVGLVVQVVELPHAGDPGRDHLAVGRPGQREVGVRVEPLRHGVHLLAPGPERPPLALGPPPQRPVERVAVGVGEPGEGEAGEAVGGGFSASSTGHDFRPAGEPAALDLHQHVVVHGAVDPGPLEQVRRASLTCSRSRVSASAETPTRQSAIDGVLGGRVRDAGRVADEQHRGRDAGRGRGSPRRGRPRSG